MCQRKVKVEFHILQCGSVDINMEWYDDSELCATQLSYLITAINSGKFEKDLISLLAEIANRKPEKYGFAKKCIEEWSKVKKSGSVIKPSQVFNTHNPHDPVKHQQYAAIEKSSRCKTSQNKSSDGNAP